MSDPTPEQEREVTLEAIKVLGMYRRRLRAHDMLPEDEDALATVLEWVEEMITE